MLDLQRIASPELDPLELEVFCCRGPFFTRTCKLRHYEHCDLSTKPPPSLASDFVVGASVLR